MRRGTRDPWRGRSAGAEAILARMAGERLASLAIVGLAKNVGKTTTLGALLDAAARRGVRVGLTSIGRDGEALDLVTGETKPRIRLAAGSLAATSADCLKKDLPVRELERTGWRGPMGEVVIVRLEDTADVEVAGPSTRDGLKAVTARLASLGAQLVLVDGAFDRRVSACPLVTDATVLAAGMALSPLVDEVAREAAHVTRLLSLPAPDLSVRSAADDAIATGVTRVLDGRGRVVSEHPGPVAGRAGELAAAARAAGPGGVTLVLCGGLTDALLESLTGFGCSVVVADATRVFVTPLALARFEAEGGRLAVAHPIRLLGVTVSPYEPGGRGADPASFLARMREALAPVPVCDVVWEGDAS